MENRRRFTTGFPTAPDAIDRRRLQFTTGIACASRRYGGGKLSALKGSGLNHNRSLAPLLIGFTTLPQAKA